MDTMTGYRSILRIVRQNTSAYHFITFRCILMYPQMYPPNVSIARWFHTIDCQQDISQQGFPAWGKVYSYFYFSSTLCFPKVFGPLEEKLSLFHKSPRFPQTRRCSQGDIQQRLMILVLESKILVFTIFAFASDVTNSTNLQIVRRQCAPKRNFYDLLVCLGVLIEFWQLQCSIYLLLML